jgi:hypothetical protein
VWAWQVILFIYGKCDLLVLTMVDCFSGQMYIFF